MIQAQFTSWAACLFRGSCTWASRELLLHELAGDNSVGTSQADILAHHIGMRQKAAFEETLLLSRGAAVLTQLSWLAIGHNQQHCRTGAL